MSTLTLRKNTSRKDGLKYDCSSWSMDIDGFGKISTRCKYYSTAYIIMQSVEYCLEWLKVNKTPPPEAKKLLRGIDDGLRETLRKKCPRIIEIPPEEAADIYFRDSKAKEKVKVNQKQSLVKALKDLDCNSLDDFDPHKARRSEKISGKQLRLLSYASKKWLEEDLIFGNQVLRASPYWHDHMTVIFGKRSGVGPVGVSVTTNWRSLLSDHRTGHWDKDYSALVLIYGDVSSTIASNLEQFPSSTGNRWYYINGLLPLIEGELYDISEITLAGGERFGMKPTSPLDETVKAPALISRKEQKQQIKQGLSPTYY